MTEKVRSVSGLKLRPHVRSGDMSNRARTKFTGTKSWVRCHDNSKDSQRREKRAIEKAARRQGRAECKEQW